MRSVIAILNQAPRVTSAARTNLDELLPRPQVETAIEQASGTADFLSKDLVAALKGINSASLMAEFNAANSRAISEIRDYVAYLQQQKLPKANDRYALGRERYQLLLEYGEMVTLPPRAIARDRIRRTAMQAGGVRRNGQTD